MSFLTMVNFFYYCEKLLPAKDLILKLTCEEENRLSATSALSHDFFKEEKFFKLLQNDEENMSLFRNMEEFKK